MFKLFFQEKKVIGKSMPSWFKNFPYVLHNIVAVMCHVPAFIKKRGVKMDK